MRNILIIGAGKSTSYIVKYLVNKSIKENLFITIGDIDIDNAKKLSTNSNKTKLFKDCEHRIPTEGSSLGLQFIKKHLY